MISFRKIIDVCRAFGIAGDPVRYKTFTDGHINSTFLVVFSHEGEESKYLVQNINTVVFKDPDALMQNVVNVTHYLRGRIREAGGDPERETLHFRKTTDGKLCLHDGDFCWRIYTFIDHSYTYDLIEDAAIFRSAGESFGRFQRLQTIRSTRSMRRFPIFTIRRSGCRRFGTRQTPTVSTVRLRCRRRSALRWRVKKTPAWRCSCCRTAKCRCV